ncbi:MAG: hypothetical protein ACLTNY_05635 [Blautia massiliensis (ex Durand et al. 2017)]
MLADAGTLTVRAGAEDACKAAESAMLGCTAAAREKPDRNAGRHRRNTASDATTLGAMQVEQAGTGILPGASLTQAQADALAANEEALRGSENHTAAERRNFTQQALAALGVTAEEEE